MHRLAAFAKVLGLGWLVWRLFGPEFEVRLSPGQVHPTRVTGRTVIVGETEFFVREAGPPDAPELVLVHGWGFDGELTFMRLIPLLASRFRVIVPDLRNHGLSTWVRGRFEVATMADELAGVLMAVGVSGATVFGWSMGGMVSQELARRHPGIARRLILGATAARPVPRRRVVARLGFWIARGLARISRSEFAAASRRILVATGSISREHQRWAQNSLMRRDPSLHYEGGAAIWRFDSRGWVGSIKQPVMVIIPTSDQVVRPETQYELASLLADPDVVELVGARHEAIFNRADEIAKVTARFVG